MLLQWKVFASVPWKDEVCYDRNRDLDWIYISVLTPTHEDVPFALLEAQGRFYPETCNCICCLVGISLGAKTLCLEAKYKVTGVQAVHGAFLSVDDGASLEKEGL